VEARAAKVFSLARCLGIEQNTSRFALRPVEAAHQRRRNCLGAPVTSPGRSRTIRVPSLVRHLLEACIMADLVSELSSKAGVSADQVKKGLGAVLALLKEKLPGNVFSQVQAAVPGADGMMADAQAAPESSGGGILGAVKEMAGKLMGGSGAAALTAKLGQLGFSPEQGQNFFTAVLEFFKNKLPADVLDKLSSLIPTSAKSGA
jgi:hypothetical protein